MKFLKQNLIDKECFNNVDNILVKMVEILMLVVTTYIYMCFKERQRRIEMSSQMEMDVNRLHNFKSKKKEKIL